MADKPDSSVPHAAYQRNKIVPFVDMIKIGAQRVESCPIRFGIMHLPVWAWLQQDSSVPHKYVPIQTPCAMSHVYG